MIAAAMTLAVAAGLASSQLATAAAATVKETVAVRRGPTGRPRPSDFLGIAFTYQRVVRWTRPAPAPVDPVLVQLIRNLAPGGHPLMRVGGISADRSWWPIDGEQKPLGIWWNLRPAELTTLRRLAQATDGRLMLGVNLEADSPAIVRVESHQLLRRIGRRYIQSLQLGNEPNYYTSASWYDLLNGIPVPAFKHVGTKVFSRPSTYGPSDYAADVARMLPELPDLPLAGPETTGIGANAASWMAAFEPFLRPSGPAVTLTAHAYAASRCIHNPTSVLFPSVPHLLSIADSRSQLSGVAPYIEVAHEHHDGFRVDELGVVSCTGVPGVGNTMASALWVLDTLFSMDSAGVNGVNLHTVRGSNALFQLRRSHGHWHATVRPWYYGALMFRRAAPAGSQLLPVTHITDTQTPVWATLGEGGKVHVLVINDSLTSRAQVRVRNPGGYGRRVATIERLKAPSAYATSGVRLGGHRFGRTTGLLAPPKLQHVHRHRGAYKVTLRPASAALLTLKSRG